MKFSAYIVSIIIATLINKECNAQVTILDAPIFRPMYRLFRNFLFDFTRSRSDEQVEKISRKLGKLQKTFKPNEPFFCDVNGPGRRSNETPTSVHKLMPGDIDIIASIGDSLTAGNGGLAVNVLQVTLEYKGVSFSIGGEKTFREYLTIPNLLKEYNPNLYGYSESVGLSIHKSSKLNVAELGAMSRDTPHMTKVLIQRMHADKNVKPHHWKLITFLIGSNDFCLDMCYHQNPTEIIKQHEQDLLKVFRLIRDNIPRVMLNVVPPPSVKVLVEFTGKKPECETTHHFECPCFFGAKFQKHKPLYYKIMQDWTDVLIRTASRDEFNRDDFTINIQPFTTKLEFPLSKGVTDYSYMTFDCFHLSQKGYALATVALWNNMLQKEGLKSNNWDWKNPYNLLCPTDDFPYLATRVNSK
ncbi:phospholipase B1, membrane-associated-like [Chironomus tepperi]|uniref:phospholipase B1, membrane-associated-like n=1 Tax=Chironomus tepperi TaxID=113505 RepID=UPI00391F4E19